MMIESQFKGEYINCVFYLGCELMRLIEIFTGMFALALGFQIWGKAVDKADTFLMEKLRSKTYNIIMNCIILTIFFTALLLIIFYNYL